jgi:hypothetical protein
MCGTTKLKPCPDRKICSSQDSRVCVRSEEECRTYGAPRFLYGGPRPSAWGSLGFARNIGPHLARSARYGAPAMVGRDHAMVIETESWCAVEYAPKRPVSKEGVQHGASRNADHGRILLQHRRSHCSPPQGTVPSEGRFVPSSSEGRRPPLCFAFPTGGI